MGNHVVEHVKIKGKQTQHFRKKYENFLVIFFCVCVSRSTLGHHSESHIYEWILHVFSQRIRAVMMVSVFTNHFKSLINMGKDDQSDLFQSQESKELLRKWCVIFL